MKYWSNRVSAMICPVLESRSFADRSHHSATPILHDSTTVYLRHSAFISGLSSSRPFVFIRDFSFSRQFDAWPSSIGSSGTMLIP
jgi:hypothetical protein